MDLADLDLGYLAQFVGARINELVLAKAEEDGYGDLRQSHGYVVQHLIEGPKQVTQLAQLLGVSQQAASKVVGELVELGYLSITVAGDRRARVVSLSAKGKAAVAATRKTRARIETKLAHHGGELARAKKLLAAVLEELGGGDAVRARRVKEPGQ